MKNSIVRFGIISAVVIFVLFAAFWIFIGTSMDYSTSEIIGYVTIGLAMVFVFLGIKTYRDKEGNGAISFGKGFQIGTLIALFPSAAIFIFTALLFMMKGEEFLAYSLENMKDAGSEAQLAQFEANKELFMNPFFQGGVMFLTVFLIGVVVAAVSALILKK